MKDKIKFVLVQLLPLLFSYTDYNSKTMRC